MHEKRIRKSGAARQPAGTVRFQRDGHEARGSIPVVAVGAMLRDGFALASKRSEGPKLRMTPSLRCQPAGESDASIAVAQETNDPLAMRQMRQETFKRSSMQPKTNHGLEPPSQPRRGKRECRGCRVGDPFAPVQPLRENRADAMPERITRGEYHCRTAAAGKDAICLERHRPGLAALTDARERQMPLAAEDRLGLGQRLSACLREA